MVGSLRCLVKPLMSDALMTAKSLLLVLSTIITCALFSNVLLLL